MADPAAPKPITMHTGSHSPEPSDRAGLSEAEREALGRRVREVWVEWAREHPNPKPSWLVPWEGLSEPDKEVDRRIGEVLYAMGAARLAVVEQERDEARAELAHLRLDRAELADEVHVLRRKVSAEARKERAEAAEQEVATLRAQVAAVEALVDEWEQAANKPRPQQANGETDRDDGIRIGVWYSVRTAATELRAALGDPAPVVQRIKDKAAVTALEKAAEAVWSDAAVEWKWSREEYRTWLRERARRVRDGGDRG